MTTLEMYKRILGYRMAHGREFDRNGWKVVEVITKEGADSYRILWDPAEGTSCYPAIHKSIRLAPGESFDDTKKEYLRQEVADAFDKIFRPGRAWAGGPEFDAFVTHDPNLKRAA